MKSSFAQTQRLSPFWTSFTFVFGFASPGLGNATIGKKPFFKEEPGKHLQEKIPQGKDLQTQNVSSISVTIDLDPSLSSPISRGIYGLGTYLGEKQNTDQRESLNPDGFRLGGNSSERFNWKISSWNAGKDWYFRNFKSDLPDPVDAFMKKNRMGGINSMITIPFLGFVAKDSSSGSYPVSMFPNQKKTLEGFGNGFNQKGQPLLADPSLANTPFGPEDITSWVSKLKLQFGSHHHRYIMGNEPMLWHETHQDVHPTPATYDQVLTKFLHAAQAVRKADPEAVIFGPALWGYLAVKQSAFDARGPWSLGKKLTDKKKHGGVDFLEWFLAEVAKEEARLKVSLLDVVDVHFYPEGERIRKGTPSLPETREARLASTRSLWDRTYKDPSWLNENLYFIPFLKEIINKTNPRRKLAIGEYNFYGEHDLAGGIALAEVLGIFSKEKLDYANYWTVPLENSPAAFAFKLFRNYDGQKSTFGETLIPNSIGIQKEASVFSALRKKDQTVTLILLNKSQAHHTRFKIDFKKNQLVGSAKLFIYNPEKNKIETKITETQTTPLLYPLSMGLFEVKLK